MAERWLAAIHAAQQAARLGSQPQVALATVQRELVALSATRAPAPGSFLVQGSSETGQGAICRADAHGFAVEQPTATRLAACRCHLHLVILKAVFRKMVASRLSFGLRRLGNCGDARCVRWLMISLGSMHLRRALGSSRERALRPCMRWLRRRHASHSQSLLSPVTFSAVLAICNPISPGPASGCTHSKHSTGAIVLHVVIFAWWQVVLSRSARRRISNSPLERLGDCLARRKRGHDHDSWDLRLDDGSLRSTLQMAGRVLGAWRRLVTSHKKQLTWSLTQRQLCRNERLLEEEARLPMELALSGLTLALRAAVRRAKERRLARAFHAILRSAALSADCRGWRSVTAGTTVEPETLASPSTCASHVSGPSPIPGCGAPHSGGFNSSTVQSYAQDEESRDGTSLLVQLSDGAWT